MVNENPGGGASLPRKRMLVWVCDVTGSSTALNDSLTVEATEEFLIRFFWLAQQLMRATGATVSKWTGDGFMAAYEFPLDRNLGDVARQVLTAAFQLTYAINTTKLGLTTAASLGIRHGIAVERDTILVTHRTEGQPDVQDVIGRGVVLAFRLSNIPSEFPNIATEEQVLEAAQDDGIFSEPFREFTPTAEELLKYFKGEGRGTKGILVSKDGNRDNVALIKRLVSYAWSGELMKALATGDPWARGVSDVLLKFQQTMALDAQWKDHRPASGPTLRAEVVERRAARDKTLEDLRTEVSKAFQVKDTGLDDARKLKEELLAQFRVLIGEAANERKPPRLEVLFDPTDRRCVRRSSQMSEFISVIVQNAGETGSPGCAALIEALFVDGQPRSIPSRTHLNDGESEKVDISPNGGKVFFDLFHQQGGHATYGFTIQVLAKRISVPRYPAKRLDFLIRAESQLSTDEKWLSFQSEEPLGPLKFVACASERPGHLANFPPV